MEKVIVVDIDSFDDLCETYNRKKISKDLIKYLLESVPKLGKEDTLKVTINNRLKEDFKCAEMIKKALDDECEKNEHKFIYSNKRQFVYFILGVAALCLAAFIDFEIIKEIILIGAWVLLWDMVESEIVDDFSNRKKKKLLKILLASDFEEIMK